MLAQLTEGSSIAIEAIAIPLLFVITLTLGRFLKRQAGVQLGLLFQLFCFVFSIWLPLEILRTDFAQRADTIRLLRAANVLLGTFFLLALFRRYYWELWYEKQRKTRAPKFLSQLLGLAVFITAIFIVIGGVYGKSIEGAVFGSTVVVGIIGFAMQDLLGNIIAGIALEFSKPFKTGDWLVVDGTRAEVVEVNWRSTRLRTPDDVHLDIPNRHIVQTTITNLSFPTQQHAVRFTVGFDYQTPPNHVKDCITRAVARAHGVLANPPPKVYLKDFGDSAVIYEIRFWMDNESIYSDMQDLIHTNIWYEAQRSGIRIPFPVRTVHLERGKDRKQETASTIRQYAQKLPFLQFLEPQQVDQLVDHARLLRFGRGEKVIEQGTAGESMFILLSGEASVFVRANSADTRVATLHSGDYFGEMSLLTGEPRSATIVAHVDCELWEIDKPIFSELLQENEQLVQRLGELLAKRRLETEGILANSAEQTQIATKQREYTEGFLKKLYSFFEL